MQLKLCSLYFKKLWTYRARRVSENHTWFSITLSLLPLPRTEPSPLLCSTFVEMYASLQGVFSTIHQPVTMTLPTFFRHQDVNSHLLCDNAIWTCFCEALFCFPTIFMQTFVTKRFNEELQSNLFTREGCKVRPLPQLLVYRAIILLNRSLAGSETDSTRISQRRSSRWPPAPPVPTDGLLPQWRGQLLPSWGITNGKIRIDIFWFPWVYRDLIFRLHLAPSQQLPQFIEFLSWFLVPTCIMTLSYRSQIRGQVFKPDGKHSARN